jgi:hypothetical protein
MLGKPDGSSEAKAISTGKLKYSLIDAISFIFTVTGPLS